MDTLMEELSRQRKKNKEAQKRAEENMMLFISFFIVSVVAFVAGQHVQYYLGMVKEEKCFEDGSCRTFYSAQEYIDWYGTN